MFTLRSLCTACSCMVESLTCSPLFMFSIPLSSSSFPGVSIVRQKSVMCSTLFRRCSICLGLCLLSCSRCCSCSWRFSRSLCSSSMGSYMYFKEVGSGEERRLESETSLSSNAVEKKNCNNNHPLLESTSVLCWPLLRW